MRSRAKRACITVGVLAVMGLLFWLVRGPHEEGGQEQVVGTARPFVGRGGERLDRPRPAPVRLQRRALDAIERGCSIRLVVPPGLEVAQAEAFAVDDFKLAEEPIVGADALGVMDLRVGAVVPRLVAIKARGAAVELVEPDCPGAQQVGLRPEAKISGFVRDRETGVAIGAATVMLSLGAARLEVVTASDGSFTLVGVPSGVHRLTATARDRWGQTDEPVLLAEGAHATGVDIRTDAAYMLRGEVEADGGSLGSGARVRVRLEAARLAGGMTASSSGAFELGPVPPGEYTLVTSGDTPECDASLLRIETVVSIRGRDQDVRVDIGARHRLRVVSVDGEGRRAPHMPLELSQEIIRRDGLIERVHRPVETDAGGEAVVCGVAPGMLTTLFQGRERVVSVPEQTEVSLTAGEAARSRVAGHLVTEDGEPVTMRDVFLIPGADRKQAQLSRSDGLGGFVFEHLVAGRYRLEVRPRLGGRHGSDPSWPAEVAEEIELKAGEAVEAELIVARAEDDVVSGMVLDARGAPVPGAMVVYSMDRGGCWAPWESGEGSTTSDGHGRFRIEDVRASVPLRVHALRSGRGRGSVGDVMAGNEGVQVRLAELGALRVRASGVAKRARHSAHCSAVIMSDAGCNLGGAHVASDGSAVVFDDLPVTGVSVRLRCLGHEDVVDATTTLVPHAIVDLDLMPL